MDGSSSGSSPRWPSQPLRTDSHHRDSTEGEDADAEEEEEEEWEEP